MTNLILNLDIATMEWSDANFRTLYTGEAFEFPPFEEGYYQSVLYTGVTVNLQNGIWKDCGSSQSQGTSLTVSLPSPGQAYTKGFCVCVQECFLDRCYRSGWFDPQLKLKNKDSTGAPTGYESGGPCSCGS